MRDLYLVRHGLPRFPGGEPTCIGMTDLPISREGEEQIRRTAECLSGRNVTAVYASDLKRAVRSAQIIAGDAPVHKVTMLREASMGAWENLPFEEIRLRFPLECAERDKDAANFAPPGGEPYVCAQRRAERGIARVLEETKGNVAIVSHAGINRAILCKVKKQPLNELFSIPQPYGCINHLREEGGRLSFVETIEP